MKTCRSENDSKIETSLQSAFDVTITSYCKRDFKILNILNICKESAKIDFFGLKKIKTYGFRGIFRQEISKEIIIIIYIPTKKHIYSVFVIGKESSTTPTDTFENSPYLYGTPNFDSFFRTYALQGEYRLYSRLKVAPSPTKKKSQGGCNNSCFGGRG